LEFILVGISHRPGVAFSYAAAGSHGLPQTFHHENTKGLKHEKEFKNLIIQWWDLTGTFLMASCERLFELITMDHGDVVDWVDFRSILRLKDQRLRRTVQGIPSS
jgi:hypothetical protein